MSADFTRSLEERIRAGAAPAVVGLDPRPEAFPVGLARGQGAAARILAYYREVLPVLAAHVPVVKPNIAFFERYGAQGYGAYCETCAAARAAGLLVIGDIKRGDIENTAEAYAEEHFRHADAVTLNPYLGVDSLRPFLARCRDQGRGVFILVRTSNPSAAEIQDLPTGEGTLCEAVARLVHRWAEEFPGGPGYSPVGAVIGATYSGIARMRELLPRSWLLLPGVGAQGATADQTVDAFDREGLGALINRGRSILECFPPGDPDWLDRVRVALASFADEARRVSRQEAPPV